MAIIVNEQFLQACDRTLSITTAWLYSTTTCKVAVFSGTMPTTIPNTWNESTYSAQELVAFTNFSIGDTTISDRRIHTVTIANPTVTASQTGTATWAAIYSKANYYYIPIVVDVSDSTGNGVVQLNTTSITAGSDVTFLGFSFTFTLTG